jgi:hypothetical protein
VVLVPVSDEKAFAALLGKINLPLEKKGDEYSIPLPNLPRPASMRLLKGYAHICVATAKIDASALLDPQDLFSARETAAATLHLRLDRLPDDLRKVFLATFTQNIEQQIAAYQKQRGPADGPLTPESVRLETALRTMRLGLRWVQLLVNDGKELTFRIDLDPKTGVLGSSMSLEARSGSDLAKSIRELPPTRNDFGRIISPDSAAHLLIQTPLFIGDLKELLAKATQMIGQGAADGGKNDIPKEGMEVITEATKALGRTLNDGKLDFAVSLRGPDRNNQFTAIGAFSMKDTSALDKALRTVVKSAPKDAAERIKIDALKVQGTNVHEIAVGNRLPPEAQKVFGNSSVYVSLAPNAAFVTFGPQGKEAITEALTGKVAPTPAPLVQTEVSGKRILALFKTLGAPQDAIQFIEKLTPAERSTVMAIKVEGGEKLVLRVELGLPALWIVAPKASTKRFNSQIF